MTKLNIMRRATVGTAIAAVLAASLAAGAPAPAFAQPSAVRPTNDVTLSVGAGQMVRLDGTMTDRIGSIQFWAFNTRRVAGTGAEPYIDPELQRGTTPLAKFTGGKATRDFQNYRHPTVDESDYLEPRAIIENVRSRAAALRHEQHSGRS